MRFGVLSERRGGLRRGVLRHGRCLLDVHQQQLRRAVFVLPRSLLRCAEPDVDARLLLPRWQLVCGRQRCCGCVHRTCGHVLPGERELRWRRNVHGGVLLHWGVCGCSRLFVRPRFLLPGRVRLVFVHGPVSYRHLLFCGRPERSGSVQSRGWVLSGWVDNKRAGGLRGGILWHGRCLLDVHGRHLRWPLHVLSWVLLPGALLIGVPWRDMPYGQLVCGRELT